VWQAFYDSLDKEGDKADMRTRVKDKRMVFYWAEKNGVRVVHETLAHSSGNDWESLPGEAASGCTHNPSVAVVLLTLRGVVSAGRAGIICARSLTCPGHHDGPMCLPQRKPQWCIQ
jgi:hypothetical protein